MVSGSASLQDELENIENIIKKYTTLAQAARTQTEMNLSSRCFFDIWDTELNNLWSRFSDLADTQTKEKILAGQRNWIAIKINGWDGAGFKVTETSGETVFFGNYLWNGHVSFFNEVFDCVYV